MRLTRMHTYLVEISYAQVSALARAQYGAVSARSVFRMEARDPDDAIGAVRADCARCKLTQVRVHRCVRLDALQHHAI